MKFINMIKQIKYQRSLGRIVSKLKRSISSDGIIEFRFFPSESISLCIFYINTEYKWICVNDESLLNAFNIKYTSDVHHTVLDFLHHYYDYDITYWNGEDIKI